MRRFGVQLGVDDDLVIAFSLEPWFIANIADAVEPLIGRRVGLIEIGLCRTLRALLDTFAPDVVSASSR